MQYTFRYVAMAITAMFLASVTGCGGSGGGGGNGGGGDNTDPVAVIAPVTPVKSTSTVTLDASGSTDADGDTLSYEWTAKAGGIEITGAGSARATFKAPMVSDALSEKFTFVVKVSDTNGGSDTAEIAVTVVEGVKPQVQLLFPAATSTTDSNDDITFRGRATDNIGVTQLHVNGVKRDVTFDDDGGWQITLPVDATANVYSFEAIDAAGNVSEAVTATITQPMVEIGEGPAFAGYREFSMSEKGELFATSASDEVVRVDAGFASHTLIADGADPDIGSGPDMENVAALEVSPESDRLRVSSLSKLVYELSLDTLERTVMSDSIVGSGVGGGPDLFTPIALATDIASDNFYAMSWDEITENHALMRIAANGDRTTISETSDTDNVTGSGPLLDSAEYTSSLAVHDGTAYHAQLNILAIDVGDSDAPGTGARTELLADDASFRAAALVLSNDKESLWTLGVSDAGIGIIKNVPLAGAVPTLVSAAGERGNGEPMNFKNQQITLAVDEEKGVAYVPYDGTTAIMQIDLATGDRVIVYNPQ